MKRFLAISLAIILLISNIGFTMGTHFCCGQNVGSELMLGQKGMPDMEKDCPQQGKHLQTKGCCENHYQELSVDDDFTSNSVKITNLTFLVAFVQSFLNISFTEYSEQDFLTYLRNVPPLPDREIIILVQSFLL